MKEQADRKKEPRKIIRWWKVLVVAYLSICFSAASIVSYDLMNDGPTTKILQIFLDFALPVFNDPDLGKDTKDLVISRGFEFESHEVITKDGYIIEIHHVFNKKFKNRQPLMIGVPLFCKSTILLSDFRNNSGAYVFADAGYDVWLTNTRGNSFGRRHVSLDPDKDTMKFFDFTYLDIGELDVAAQIDYVLEYTKHRKVFYVGASQGAAILFALLSKNPAYNDKIQAMASYGGFRSMCYTDNKGVKVLSYLTWPLSEIVLKIQNLAAVMTHSPFHQICKRIPHACGTVAVNFGMKYDYYFNKSRYAIYSEHIPDGTSVKNLIYYGQAISSGCDGTIREFDYDHGPWTELLITLGLAQSKNMAVYGSKIPPIIDFSRINVPMKLYYSDGDDFVTPKETMVLADAIGIPEWDIHRIEDPLFTHVNYVFNKQRNDFLMHTIDYFRGLNTSWPLEKTQYLH